MSDTNAMREAIKGAMNRHGWLGEQCVTDIMEALALLATDRAAGAK